METPALTIQVQKDLTKPSSFEDDIGDGELGGISRTDAVGHMRTWTPPRKKQPPVIFYRLNPPPQEFPPKSLEDMQDADDDTSNPREIVEPLSASEDTRGPDFMQDNEGRVDTEWPGQGAPKGFWSEQDEPAATAATSTATSDPITDAIDDSPDAETTATDSIAPVAPVADADGPGEGEGAGEGEGVEDKSRTPTASLQQRVLHGPLALEAPKKLLSDLQKVIVQADRSRHTESQLRRKLAAANRLAARLRTKSAAAEQHYIRLSSDEKRILDTLRAVDAK